MRTGLGLEHLQSMNISGALKMPGAGFEPAAFGYLRSAKPLCGIAAGPYESDAPPG